MPFNKTYPLKVWVASVVLGPLLVYAVQVITVLLNDGFIPVKGQEIYGLFFWIIVIVFSLPTITISYLIYRYLILTQIRPCILKLTMFTLGMLLFFVTLKVIGIPVNGIQTVKDLFLHIYFIIPFTLATIFFNVKKQANPPEATNT